MMWAPIANNIIAIGVLTAYLLVYGKAQDLCGSYTSSQELLLGLVHGRHRRAAGDPGALPEGGRRTHRPRFDFRDAGLGHTLRLGYWTVLFVIVNQIAYTIVVRLASSGTAQPDACGVASGTGYSIYSSAFLIIMVPHSVVTVSLATAILPRLSGHAADADLRGLAGTLAAALRTALAVVVPFAVLLPVVAPDLANFVWGHGATGSRFWLFVPTLSLFGPGLVFFSVHYLMLRGFYALERTRTVFAIQCVIAATNIAAAILLVRSTGPQATSPALVAAYVASYLLGAALSYAVLRRLLGGLGTRELGRYLVRLAVAVAGTGAVTLLLTRLLHGVAGRTPDPWLAAGLLALEVVVAGVVYLGMARLLRLREVTAITNTLVERLPSRLRSR
ncbi:MAG: lipid II flippase MurJ [Nocardioides sp.]